MTNVRPSGYRPGLTLVEAALVLGVTALVFGGFAQALSTASENNKAKAAADRLGEVTQAAQQFMKANQQALLAATAPTLIQVGRASAGSAIPGAGALGLPSVQGGGFLPADYVDVNSYGQGHALIVKSVPSTTGGPPHLEALVTTSGGNTIPDRLIGQVAKFMGVQGGFMMSTPLAGTPGTEIVGVNGGWEADAGSWSAGGVVPTKGHVMATVSSLDQVLGDYLVRSNIGIPEANTMRTDLFLGGKDAAGDVLSKNQILDVGAVSNGDTELAITDPNALTIGPNITIPGYENAGGNIASTGGNVSSARGNVFAGGGAVPPGIGPNGNVIADDALVGKEGAYAPVYYDINDRRYYLAPSGQSYLNDVHSERFSADTVLYGQSLAQFGDTNGELGIRLGDLLPHWVDMGGYVGVNGAAVPKPACGPNGQHRILLSAAQDSQAFTPNVTATNVQPGTVIGGDVNHYAPYYVGQGYYGSDAVFADSNQILTANIKIGQDLLSRRLFALDPDQNNQAGMDPWLIQFQGTPADPNVPQFALAHTYCFYGYDDAVAPGVGTTGGDPN